MGESVRTFWKGHLRLALVAIPIRLVSAEKAEETPRFHQIDRESGQRVRYLKVVPGRGEVKKENIVSGYEVEPGNYVLVEEHELDAVKLASRHTIELTQFVEMCEIDPLYFERPYYVLPDGDVAEEGYIVIRDALKASRKAAIGQLTLRGREHLVALYPGGSGLVLDTLRYESEIKDADDIFSSIAKKPARADMLAMAEQLIGGRTESFDPGKFKNHYSIALRDLVKAKLASGSTLAIDEPEKKGAQVLDFMEALKRSLAGGAKASDEKASRKKGSADEAKAPAKAAKAPAKTPTKKAPAKKSSA
jgi:DNA end-binding protein Ku